MLEAKLFLFIC